LLASDRLWIACSAAFSRASNFITNIMLARYGGAAALGTYSVALNTAAAAVQPVTWSVLTSATLEARAARNSHERRAVVLAHVYWALLLSVVCGLAFPLLVGRAGVDTTHDLLAMVTGLVVVASMMVTTALQGALHGAGEYKPYAVRLVAVSLVCVVVAVPAVRVLGLAGGLATLCLQYLLLVGALLHLAQPTATEPWLVSGAFAAAKRQLIRSLPNVLANLIATGASWLTTIYVVKQSHGMVGVGIFAVATSWLTILMMPVAAWGGLSMRILSTAHASSLHELRAAIRRVLIKDVSFTLMMATLVFCFARRIAGLYALASTPLPAILRVTAITAVVMAVTLVYERSMFCIGEQRAWLRVRVIGNLCTLGLAYWLVPIKLEYGAIAVLSGYACTAVLCVARRWPWATSRGTAAVIRRATDEPRARGSSASKAAKRSRGGPRESRPSTV
jgi:O-antigen/teichoic acid export membrane protein